MATRSQQRKIKLKQLLDRGEEIRNNLGQCDVSQTLLQINEVVTDCNNIIADGDIQERREHTTEVVMDAQVIKMNHELVSKVFERSSQFNEQIFIKGLEDFLCKDGEWQWNLLSDIAVDTVRCCRAKSTMYGAVEKQCKEHLIKQRHSRVNLTQEKEDRPELVNSLQRKDKGAEKVNYVHKQVAQLFQRHQVQAMPLYKLVVDPNDFMMSIENALQLAHLVRDKKMGLREGADGYPEVWLIKSDEHRSDVDKKETDIVLTFDLCRVSLQNNI